MREGVSRDGSHLFPAFPYDHFTRLSDADIAALYAFFMTRVAVNAPARKSGLPFPLNIRALQAGWKLLYFRPARFVPQPGKSDEWNRGAYLAEGISHCGACHTPRNWLGAEQPTRANGGAVIDSWIAPALTAANPSPVPWNWDELFAYLRTGVSRWHGTAAGPMAPVVHDGLSKLPDADIQAIAIYFADIGGAAARSGEAEPAIQKALQTDHMSEQQRFDPASRLYTAACASYHYNGTSGPSALRPELALNSALYLDEPTNLLQVILHGINAADGAPGVVMPAFTGFSNADVAGIASYLRATRTNRPAWTDLENKVAVIRAQSSQP
jgi:mono/diheme cytochrome c family protein